MNKHKLFRTQHIDQCQPEANLKSRSFFFSPALPKPALDILNSPIGHFASLYIMYTVLMASVFTLVFFTQDVSLANARELASKVLWQLFFLLQIFAGLLIALYLLAENRKKKAFEASRHQLLLLKQEVVAHKKNEQELQLAKEYSDNANQAKTRYLSGVSHELRTPLNTVYGYAQLLERDSNLPEKVSRIARIIIKNGEHITDIIEGLLEISKIEARKVEYLHKEHINLDSLITPLVESFSMQAQDKGIAFLYSCKSELPAYVSTDAKRIRQILMNLLSNAIKFTPKGSVELNIAYRNEVARFTISDTGIGITQENQNRIFDPFERVHNNDTQSIPGTGLGLSISRLLAELLGGNIAVESTPGKGSTFVFSVLLPAVATPNFQVSTRREIKGYKGARKNILVVDDEPDHRTLVNNLLSPLRFNVFESGNAHDAIEKMQLIHIDLFILDVFMPDMDGWSLAQHITATGSTAPIIMVSGNAIEDHREEINGKLHDYYLIKPVIFDDLLNKAGSALNLEWIYEDELAPIVLQGKPDAKIVPPPAAILLELKAAAAIGHIKAVTTLLQRIRLMDASYKNFADALDQCLQDYNLPAIITLIENHQ